MKRNSGKTAIVTGASSGIGRASAEALAKSGFTVFGTSRRTTSNGPNGVIMLTGDVTDGASVAAVVKSVIDETGRIDLLVNSAGFGLSGGAEEFSTEEVKALFDVNVFGIARLTRAVLPAMRAQGQGRIVNISSKMPSTRSPSRAMCGTRPVSRSIFCRRSPRSSRFNWRCQSGAVSKPCGASYPNPSVLSVSSRFSQATRAS